MRVCLKCENVFESSDWVCPTCKYCPELDRAIPLFSPALARENDGFCADFFDELANLEAKNFWFRARNDLIISALVENCPEMRNFMEIGCGTGYVLSGVARYFPKAQTTGTEIFSKGLSYAGRRTPGAELIQADARHLPYQEHFDAIGAFDVLEHIEEDSMVLKQIFKALVPGGSLILTVPQHSWLWSKQDELAHHVRRYKASDLRRKVEVAGFSVASTRSFVSLLLPLLWIVRHRASSLERSDALVELRVGLLTNTFLGAVMKLEFFLSRIGVRFPAGGSLLLVARKPIA